MEQIKGQISLYDFFTQDIPLAYCEAEHVGKMIKFQDLESYVGKRVVLSCPTSTRECYRVVLVTSYRKDSDPVWKSKTVPDDYINDFLHELNHSKDNDYYIDHICDRIGYTDDNRRYKENSWVGEEFCSNGRWKPIVACAECFYEYK